MEFRFNLNEIFKKPIVEVGQTLIPSDFKGDRRGLWDALSKITDVINAMGTASASAQNLTRPITTADRLRNSEQQQVYLLIDHDAFNGKGAVTGMLKTGKKGLYVFDREGHHYHVQSPCVLDFYIHESRQRSGFGKKLFEHMLQREEVHPEKLAIDRPSEKFLGFLNKHYSLNNPIRQMNNYVVYDGFFPQVNDRGDKSPINNNGDSVSKRGSNGLQAQIVTSPYGRYGAPRPPCSMGQIIHNQSAAMPVQEPAGEFAQNFGDASCPPYQQNNRQEAVSAQDGYLENQTAGGGSGTVEGNAGTEYHWPFLIPSVDYPMQIKHHNPYTSSSNVYDLLQPGLNKQEMCPPAKVPIDELGRPQQNMPQKVNYQMVHRPNGRTNPAVHHLNKAHQANKVVDESVRRATKFNHFSRPISRELNQTDNLLSLPDDHQYSNLYQQTGNYQQWNNNNNLSGAGAGYYEQQNQYHQPYQQYYPPINQQVVENQPQQNMHTMSYHHQPQENLQETNQQQPYQILQEAQNMNYHQPPLQPINDLNQQTGQQLQDQNSQAFNPYEQQHQQQELELTNQYQQQNLKAMNQQNIQAVNHQQQQQLNLRAGNHQNIKVASQQQPVQNKQAMNHQNVQAINNQQEQQKLQAINQRNAHAINNQQGHQQNLQAMNQRTVQRMQQPVENIHAMNQAINNQQQQENLQAMNQINPHIINNQQQEAMNQRTIQAMQERVQNMQMMNQQNIQAINNQQEQQKLQAINQGNSQVINNQQEQAMNQRTAQAMQQPVQNIQAMNQQNVQAINNQQEQQQQKGTAQAMSQEQQQPPTQMQAMNQQNAQAKNNRHQQLQQNLRIINQHHRQQGQPSVHALGYQQQQQPLEKGNMQVTNQYVNNQHQQNLHAISQQHLQRVMSSQQLQPVQNMQMNQQNPQVINNQQQNLQAMNPQNLQENMEAINQHYQQPQNWQPINQQYFRGTDQKSTIPGMYQESPVMQQNPQVIYQPSMHTLSQQQLQGQTFIHNNQQNGQVNQVGEPCMPQLINQFQQPNMETIQEYQHYQQPVELSNEYHNTTQYHQPQVKKLEPLIPTSQEIAHVNQINHPPTHNQVVREQPSKNIITPQDVVIHQPVTTTQLPVEEEQQLNQTDQSKIKQAPHMHSYGDFARDQSNPIRKNSNGLQMQNTLEGEAFMKIATSDERLKPTEPFNRSPSNYRPSIGKQQPRNAISNHLEVLKTLSGIVLEQQQNKKIPTPICPLSRNIAAAIQRSKTASTKIFERQSQIYCGGQALIPEKRKQLKSGTKIESRGGTQAPPKVEVQETPQPKLDRPQTLSLLTSSDDHLQAQSEVHEINVANSELDNVENDFMRIEVSPRPAEDEAGDEEPQARKTPSHLTDQGYFDLKFYHNKLW